MLRPGGSVKISRREVKALLMTGAMLAASNAGVRWLVERVRRQRFELRLGDAPALRTAG
jgi:farnesyl-diphosphate farnesyltransferase